VAKPDENKIHTFEDWLTWDGSWELINGKAYNMSPAPTPLHQFITGELHFALRTLFQNRNCYVFAAPFDVFFAKTGIMNCRIMLRSPIFRSFARRTNYPEPVVTALRY